MKIYEVTISKDIDIDVEELFDQFDEDDQKDFIVGKFEDIEEDDKPKAIGEMFDTLTYPQQGDAMKLMIDKLTADEKAAVINYIERGE